MIFLQYSVKLGSYFCKFAYERCKAEGINYIKMILKKLSCELNVLQLGHEIILLNANSVAHSLNLT